MPQITLGEPVLVSQAPVEVKKWGPWQFPHLERLADGRIHLEHNVEADSVTAYGLPTRHALSADDGRTWEAVEGSDARGGLLLPNGDRLLPVQLQSRNRDEVELPEPVVVQEGAPSRITHIYRAADLPAELSGWRFLRLRSGEAGWIEETASVRMPGEIRIVREGVYAFWPSFRHGCLQLAPDGSLWCALHTMRIVEGKCSGGQQHRLPAFRGSRAYVGRARRNPLPARQGGRSAGRPPRRLHRAGVQLHAGRLGAVPDSHP